MDHADSPLAGSAEPLHHSLAGKNAGPGQSSVMKRDFYSDGQGKGRLPLATLSQKRNLRPFTQKI